MLASFACYGPIWVIQWPKMAFKMSVVIFHLLLSLTNSTKTTCFGIDLCSAPTGRITSLSLYQEFLYDIDHRFPVIQWNQLLLSGITRASWSRSACAPTEFNDVGYQRKCNGKHANGSHGERFATRRQTASRLFIPFLCFVINCSEVRVPHATLLRRRPSPLAPQPVLGLVLSLSINW